MYLFTVKPFCKPGQVNVYGVAKHEKIHVSCEVLANPKDGGESHSSSKKYQTNGLKFDWVFNSSSERIDLPQDRIEVVGSRSLAEHMPKVLCCIHFVYLKSSFLIYTNQKYSNIFLIDH